MSTLRLYETSKYGDELAGVNKTQDDTYRAHIVLGRVGDAHVVIEAEGPQEIIAVERLLQKCKAWSTLMSLNLTEAIGPVVQRYEAEATAELMKSMGGGFTSFGGGKKSEPS